MCSQILDNEEALALYGLLRYGKENYEEFELEIVGKWVSPIPSYTLTHTPFPPSQSKSIFLPLFKTVAKEKYFWVEKMFGFGGIWSPSTPVSYADVNYRSANFTSGTAMSSRIRFQSSC